MPCSVRGQALAWLMLDRLRAAQPDQLCKQVIDNLRASAWGNRDFLY
jgi:hypothetical protein